MNNKLLDIAPEVSQALSEGRPVVALESTIISHGMPYPKNVETALRVEQTIRDNGAVPATIAVIGGRLKAGLSRDEIEYLGRTGRGVAKASRRDLPALVARGADGVPPAGGWTGPDGTQRHLRRGLCQHGGDHHPPPDELE